MTSLVHWSKTEEGGGIGDKDADPRLVHEKRGMLFRRVSFHAQHRLPVPIETWSNW